MNSYSADGKGGKPLRSSGLQMAAVSETDSMSSFRTLDSQESLGLRSDAAVGTTMPRLYDGYRSGLSSGAAPRNNNYDRNSSLIPCTESLSSDSSFVPVHSLPSGSCGSSRESLPYSRVNVSAYGGSQTPSRVQMSCSNSGALGVSSGDRVRDSSGSNRHADPSGYPNFRDRSGNENSTRNTDQPYRAGIYTASTSNSNYSAGDFQPRYSAGESQPRYAGETVPPRPAVGSASGESYSSGRPEQVATVRGVYTRDGRSQGMGSRVDSAHGESRPDAAGSSRYGDGRSGYDSGLRLGGGEASSALGSSSGRPWSGRADSTHGGSALRSGERSQHGGNSDLPSGWGQRARDQDLVGSHPSSYPNTHSRLSSLGQYNLSDPDLSGSFPHSSPLESLPTRKIRHVQVLRDEQLGHGAYGAVYRARCDHVLLCAAKVLHPILKTDHNNPKSPSNRFVIEREWMSTLRHPNIVQYLGCHVEPDESLVLLMELMDKSLTDFLEREPTPLPYRTQLIICHDIAMALSYLHSNEIIHRDLSSNNVLLIGDARAKVGDFGMAKMFSNCRTNITACPGTEQYMPPEVINEPDKAHTYEIDSFSFGVLMVQIVTLEYPNPGNRSKPSSTGYGRVIVPETERRQQHLTQMGGHALKDVTLRCLSDIAESRPSSRQLCTMLESFRKQVDPRVTDSRGGGGSSGSSSSSGYSHLRRDSGDEGNKGGTSDDPKKLKRQIAELERQVRDLQRSRRYSADDVSKEKARQEHLQHKRLEYSNSSTTMTSTSGTPAFLSLDSIEEDEMATSSLPAALLSSMQEESPPGLKSLSVSSPELDSHDSTVVDRPRTIKFDVEVEEVSTDHAIKLEAFLTSLEDSAKNNLMVEPPSSIRITKKFTCKIQYTPRSRGKHRITLNADGKEKCSKEVFISAPKHFIKVVRKMPFNKRIHCLIVKDHFIYCTVPDRGEFCLLNRETAEELVPVKCNRRVRGIALGPDNHLYVTGDHVVQKYSQDGWKIMASFGGDKAVEYKSPSGIGIFNNSVFVCDTGNGRIVVCDLSLNKVRIINRLFRQKMDPINIRAPEDVAFDEAGRMFIADSAWKRILICALDGNYMGEIAGDQRNKTDLHNPKAVAVWGDKLYVTDQGAACIAIFDITSCNRVNKIPLMGDPVGLCFDENGYIYTSRKIGAGYNIVVY